MERLCEDLFSVCLATDCQLNLVDFDWANLTQQYALVEGWAINSFQLIKTFAFEDFWKI